MNHTLVSVNERALLLGSGIGFTEGQALVLRVLDRLQVGVVLIDHQTSVVSMNHLARSIVGRNDGLRLFGGVLAAHHFQETIDLHKMLKKTSPGGGAPASGRVGSIFISRPSFLPSLGVSVFALPGHGKDKENEENICGLIFMFDPEREVDVSLGVLGDLYDLTPAEARLAASLVQGGTLSEIAIDGGVSPNTLRTHLKNIYQKTGATRQVELVRTILTGPAVYEVEGDGGR